MLLLSYEYDCSLELSWTDGVSAVLLVGALSLLELVIFSILLLAEASVLTPTLLSSDLSALLTETVTLTFQNFAVTKRFVMNK